jgi:predicted flap endonuclease-1-like 5' DNA nuclease
MDATTVYIVLVVMLLGAFFIGVFFGAHYFTAIPDIQNNSFINSSDKRKSDAQQTDSESRTKSRLDMLELQPGSIRATRTRDRTGSLSREGRQEIIDSTLDFNRLGAGDARNASEFQKIVGIGPIIEEKLNHIGIYNYNQLANMNDKDIDIITTLITFFPERILRDDWRGQAKTLMDKK